MITDFVSWLKDIHDIDISEEAVEYDNIVVYKGEAYRNKDKLRKVLETKPMVLNGGMATIDDESVEFYGNKLRTGIINKILRKL